LQQLASVAAMLAMPLSLPAQDPASSQGFPSLLDEFDIELKATAHDKPKNGFAEFESNGGGWRRCAGGHASRQLQVEEL
jgi:hypothetical protein